MTAKLTARQWVVVAILAGALLLFWSSRITDAPVVDDAGQNLWMALNLKTYGVISLSESAPIQPSMQREPLPAFVGMLAVRAVDALLGPAPASDYFHGERAQLLKYQNILWLALLCGAVFVIAQRLGLSFWAAVLCVLLGNALLLRSEYGFYMLNSILTESAAAALLAWGSLLLALGCSGQRWWLVAWAGLCFGLLALVKAAFLYVALGLVVAIPVLAWWQQSSIRFAALQALVLGGAAAVIVLPWMLRNQSSVGYFGIAGRGGEGLYTRAVMDQVTPDEYRGAFYAWAPYPLGGAVRRVLGYSKADLEAGGRLQRLNEASGTSFASRDLAAEMAGLPQNTLTYYRRSRAVRVILVNQFEAAANPQPLMAADHELMHRGVDMISHSPWPHLEFTLPSLWRGACYSFPPLLLAFVFALRRRRYELQLMLLPALGSVLFYALASFFEPRYAMPTYPIIVCLLVAFAAHSFRTRRGR